MTGGMRLCRMTKERKMEYTMKKIIVTMIILCAARAFCQTVRREPSIGYAYPAGGQKGTVVQVTVGGQYLQGVSGAHVSGEGVSASGVKYIPILNSLQRQELQKRLREIREKRMQAARGGRQAVPPARDEMKKEGQDVRKGPEVAAMEEKPVKLPEHPLLVNLENLTQYELTQVSDIFLPYRRLQIKRSIQEMVILDVMIEEDAKPGRREFRLKTPNGLTNPVFFHVGTDTEFAESEPDDTGEIKTEACSLPAVFNGQIMPGDVDRFRFSASKGQNIVIEAQARQIVPYMADAVPGWFQAVLLLRNPDGGEAAYADDYRSSPDPVIFFTVPQDGEYTLEIRDSIFRGREDFVYRVYAGERPFVSHIFPLGGMAGRKTAVALSGENLPVKTMHLDTSPGNEIVRRAVLSDGSVYSNTFFYAVDDLPESAEKEPNDYPDRGQAVSLPQTLNGRISRQGDTDIFRLECTAGYELEAEVYARRLGSPVDSMLRLTDDKGKVLAWNDDYEDLSSGLNTHHADSFLSYRVTAGGTYYLHVSDVQGHGGDDYSYRLRMGPLYPDFALRANPSTINLRAGCSTPVKIHLLRKKGFSGSVELSLVGETHGVSLDGGLIPAGRDIVYITLTAPEKIPVSTFSLQMEGRSEINGRETVRTVVAADEMMQAFAYFHLVPAEDMTASILRSGYRFPRMLMRSRETVRIPSGGSTSVEVDVQSRMEYESFTLQLKDPPEGISIGGVKSSRENISFFLRADGNKAKKGLEENLLVEVFSNVPFGKPDEKGIKPRRRMSLGFMPVIHAEVI